MSKHPQEFFSAIAVGLVGIATWAGFVAYLSTKLAVPSIL